MGYDMTDTGKDTLGTRSTLNVGGTEYAYYSLAKAAEQLGDVSRLPISMKVLLENMLRFEGGGFTVGQDHIQANIDGHHARSTGADAFSQSMMPPARFVTSYPSRSRYAVARADRLPERQCTIMIDTLVRKLLV